MIQGMNKQLIQYIQSSILPHYDAYEIGHGRQHIQTVIENSFAIIQEHHLQVNEDMVYCIASYHDIGICFGRKYHEFTSAIWLYEDATLQSFFTQEERILMKEAIEDHRASSAHQPRSIYGRIIAEADRDIEPMRILDRCISYAQDKHPTASKEEIKHYVLTHLEEKYGDHGYLKLTLPTKKNMEGLQRLRHWLNTKEIHTILEKKM